MKPSRVSKVEENWVSVVPYNPEWPAAFAEEAAQLQVALSDIIAAIEHFGSTAVPGLAAKPIVDILIGTEEAVPPTDNHIETLAKLGYEFLGEDGRRPGRWFFRKRGQINFNMSMVPLHSDLWQDNLLIRDFLRSHPEEVQHYAAVKRQAAEASPNSLLAYQNHKRAYVEELKEKARQHRRE